MSSTDVLQRLAALFPPERLLTRPGALAPYESDGLTAFRTRPRAVVLAESQDEVIETVRLCHEHGVPFIDHIRPENWYEPEWFKAHRVPLHGTGTVYRVHH